MNKRFWWSIVLVAACVGPLIWTRSHPVTSAPPSPSLDLPAVRSKIEPALLREYLGQYKRSISYIAYLSEQADWKAVLTQHDTLARRQAVVAALQSTAMRSQKRLLSILEQEKAQRRVVSYRSFWICNAVAVESGLESLLRIAALPEVRVILRDRRHRLEDALSVGWESARGSDIPWNIVRVGADLVWSRLRIDGSGVVVASVDTGVDAQHPALRTRYRGYNPKGLPSHAGNWYCATSEGYLYPGDGHGHGTHVMGTIVGLDGIGMAPGAQWIAVKAFDNSGYTYDSWLHAAFQWILAPEGDPSLAPNLVNCSWGSDLSDDETLRPDVQALQAAGILTIFAAGNSGPKARSINSPASFPESVAVGATDDRDKVTSFSSRGPSPWNEIKPEIVAPGVDVLSSVPGGGYALQDGTSMAAPHVSGAAALLLQADLSLTPAQIIRVITSTANLSDSLPNNLSGWGRLDAYRALLQVTQAGILRGTVLRSRDRTPLNGAIVTAQALDSGQRSQVRTDAAGRYECPLAPGWYEITAACFGYESARARQVEIIAGNVTQRDFTLTPLPMGAVIGRVTEAGNGVPLAAVISVNATISTTADLTTGLYSLALPAGVYTLRAESTGHRVAVEEGVRVNAGDITSLDFILEKAPSILLVDSGAWYYNSQIRYYQQALDDLGYLYETWAIRDPRQDLPSASDLSPYDIVIWSAPEDAPGFVGAADALTEYLDGGGRLFLSGQDIAFWDGGGAILSYSPYFTLYLKARYIRDDAGRADLVGRAGDIFGGISWPLNGEESARNQYYPDEVAPWDMEHAVSIADYEGDGCAGLRIGACLPYRVVYLAAGFEGLGHRESRAQLLERSLNWLMAPCPAAGLEISVSQQPGLPLDGDGRVVTHTLRLRNTGALTDSYQLEVIQAAWPITFWDTDFQQPLADGISIPRLNIGSCQSACIGVRVEVPAGTGWNRFDQAIITVRSQNDPTLTRQVTLTSKTPAPILLVDDDRWYHVEAAYEDALRTNGLPYDCWEVGWNAGDARGSPPLSILKSHPLVIWFTGCDWANPLSAQEEERLSLYLEGGGRLFLSGQDYLFAHGLTDFAVNYLGVLTYTEDLTTTMIYGAEGSPIAREAEPYELDYPYENWSDALVPTDKAQVAFFGKHHHACGLTWTRAGAGPQPRTVFFAFPFEALAPQDARRVMAEIAFWQSPLGDSIFDADRTVATAGDLITFTISLRNNGITTTLWLTNPLPSSLHYLPGSLTGGGEYDAAERLIRWQGTLAAGDVVTVTYRARVTPSLPEGATIANPIHLDADLGFRFQREILVRVNAPDLSLSEKRAHAPFIAPWEYLTYTITLCNSGVRVAEARLEDILPLELRCVPESVRASEGVVTATTGSVLWAGHIEAGGEATIRYRAKLAIPRGGRTLVNEAIIHDGTGGIVRKRCRVWVPALTYLPRLAYNAR